jgi:hypothetical protein
LDIDPNRRFSDRIIEANLPVLSIEDGPQAFLVEIINFKK